MARLAWHNESQRMLDFCDLSESDQDLAASLHGSIPRGSGILRCPLAPRGDPSSELLVKLSDHGNYFAAHFPGDAHDGHDAEAESISHHRLKDYMADAAEREGLTAVTERPVPGGVLDVAITGGAVPTDMEVQHTPIQSATVTKRTRTYARAGWRHEPAQVAQHRARHGQHIHRLGSRGAQAGHGERNRPWAPARAAVHGCRVRRRLPDDAGPATVRPAAPEGNRRCDPSR
jgi:hypothetical protein